MKDFSDEFKIRVFDKIAMEYFDRNFGSMSKSDLETLLFSEYIEYLIETGQDFDDYTMSKQLGITQSRISSLKERKELKYPINREYWRDAFAETVKYAKYDEEKKRIIIPIEDTNVRIEVRHFIDQMRWFDEYQLNRKLLTLPMGCFLELCTRLNEDDVFNAETKKRIKALGKKEGAGKAVSEFSKDFTIEGFKKFAAEASKQLLIDALGLMPFGGTAKVIISYFCDVIDKM